MKTAKDILDKVFLEDWEFRAADYPFGESQKAMIKAMEEYASLISQSKDERIAELENELTERKSNCTCENNVNDYIDYLCKSGKPSSLSGKSSKSINSGITLQDCHKENILAPLYQQAIDWFENKGIHIMYHSDKCVIDHQMIVALKHLPTINP